MAKVSSLLAALQLVTIAAAGAPYCMPKDACHPSAASWASFNKTVGGRLIKNEPYGAPCYAPTYNAAQCQKLVAEKTVAAARVTWPGALMYTNLEQTSDGSGCPVPDATADGSAPPPVNTTCTLGDLSSYTVNATCADHVAAAVSGHDYTGRASAEGSLAVWTHYFNAGELIRGFVPVNTKAEPHDVIAAGPGLNVQQLVDFGASHGVVTMNGFTPTVGAAGGYIIGGGTGPFGRNLGLGVDNVVQYDVVTADGQKLTTNANTHPDLFWALRGGGAAFATTTRVYIKAYPAYKNINVVGGTVTCNSTASYNALTDAMVDIQVSLYNHGEGGIWELNPAEYIMSVLMYNFFPGDAKYTAQEELGFYKPIMNIPGCSKVNLQGLRFSGPTAYGQIYQSPLVIALLQAGGLVGVNLVDQSRIITYEQVYNKTALNQIKSLIRGYKEPFIWQNAVGGAASKVAPDATAINPGWRKAFAFIDSPIFGPWQGVTDDQMAAFNATAKLLDSVFGTDQYYNEQFPYGDNWQERQWGSNYKRLLQIKKKVDPTNLFACTRCVGSEAGS